MSYFTEQTDAQSQTTPAPEAQTEDFVAKVVAEKGEHWKDPATLAKGYISAQEHIKTLMQEKQALLESVSKHQTLEELLAKTQKAPEQPTQPNTTPELDISAKVREELLQLETARARETNLQNVDKRLQELYGDTASQAVEAQRQALGMSKEQLAEIAAQSPDAFFRLVGAVAPKREENKTLNGTVNTASFSANPSNLRNAQYWAEQRRTNKVAYDSPKATLQREQDFKDLSAKGLW